MNEKEFAELAAGHAVNALSVEDEQRHSAALAAHPEWSSITESDAETVALLADAVVTVTPPISIRDALLAQIAVTPQGEIPAERTASPFETSADAPAAPRRWGRMLFALAASVALVVGIGVGVSVLGSQLNRPASVIALEQIEAAGDAQQATVDLEDGAQATAHWSASVGDVVLVTEGLASLDEDSAYELWFVREDGAVPAGVFDTDAGTATALLEGTMREGDVIAVTVEQAGGSPTGEPTTDPIIVIPTA